jgi:hypothetical protein
MTLYHSLHGERYRDWNGRWNGHDLWREALDYLGRAVRREHGLIWLDDETKVRSCPCHTSLRRHSNPVKGNLRLGGIKTWRREQKRMGWDF